MRKILFATILLLITGFNIVVAQIPEDFVDIQELDTTIKVELRYVTSNNFMGRKVDGYQVNKAYMTRRAAKALHQAHRRAWKMGLGLLIFDAYRPQRAVDHFVRWSEDPQDTLQKANYYPDYRKSSLFARGFIASKSGHSRGSTVDLTLYRLETGEALDMGSPFDLFAVRSYHRDTTVNAEQRYNRDLLKNLMQNAGFRPYGKEWWHYTLNNEPYPDRYFDFVIE